ncbi:MAG TPA: hypothetical protein VHT72_05610 [Puia sp.]|nr:hypothetical protein [Puia sp.]
MMRLIRLIFVFFIHLRVHGQLSHVQSENSYISAGAYSHHFSDAFSFVFNPSCLGEITNFQAGILTERKWMLKELENTEMTSCFSMGNGGVGLALQHSGDAGYREQSLGLAYGLKAGKMRIGTGFTYLLDQAAGYQAVGFGSVHAGICFHISDKLTTGWVLGLPVFGIAGKTNPERGPQFFNMGFGYEWSPELFMSVEFEKESGLPAAITAYAEYRYGEQFSFAFGINGRAGAIYFKSGWKKNRLGIQIYSLFEPVLGFSPGIALLWESKNKKG